MNLWLAVSLVLGVITIYLFVIEAFSVAFKLTGLATKKIKFQVASLFTGVGFTTGESELITNDEKRRKIALACIYTGHIFSVLIMGLAINVLFSVATSISTKSVASDFTAWYFIILYVTSGLFLIMLIIKIPPVNKAFQNSLERVAINASKKRRNTNFVTVVDVYGKNAIVEVVLNNLPEFTKEKTLVEMELNKNYAINVLSIRRGNRTVEVTKDTMFRKGDVLVIYGLINDVKEAFVNSVDPNHTVVMDKTNEIGLLSNYGANALMEVEVDVVPKELDGVPMKDSHLSDVYHINIVVIKRANQYVFATKDTIIEKGDKITLFGPYKNIKHLFSIEQK